MLPIVKARRAIRTKEPFSAPLGSRTATKFDPRLRLVAVTALTAFSREGKDSSGHRGSSPRSTQGCTSEQIQGHICPKAIRLER